MVGQEGLSTLKQMEEVLVKSMKNRGVDLTSLQCGFLDKEMVEKQLDDGTPNHFRALQC